MVTVGAYKRRWQHKAEYSYKNSISLMGGSGEPPPRGPAEGGTPIKQLNKKLQALLFYKKKQTIYDIMFLIGSNEHSGDRLESFVRIGGAS